MNPKGPRSVLLVEDNPGDAFLVSELFKSFKRPEDSFEAVEDLRNALLYMGQRSVDAVLLDLHLPDASGLDCVGAIGNHSPEVAIIVLTGLDDAGLALDCLGAGAQDYLLKSGLGADALRRSIAYALARTKERVQRRRADALQAQVAAIVDSSSDGILSSTPDGVIKSWNRGAERIFGFSSQEAIGQSIYEIFRVGSSAEESERERRMERLGHGIGDDLAKDLVRLRKDGTEVIVSVVSSVIRGPDSEVLGLAAICRDVTESRRRDQELRTKNVELVERDRHMRALTERLIMVREEERARISRTVHDDLGQLLTGLKMDLRWLARRINGPQPLETGPIAQRLAEAERLTDATVSTVQQIAIDLRPSALDALGLAAAIRDEAGRFRQRSGLAVTVEVLGDEQPPKDVATALFRILQELLTNVVRHSRASAVTIELASTPAVWRLKVADNGVGMSEADIAKASSLGFLGMQERAAALGGRVELENGAGPGSVVRVEVPRPQGEGR